MKKVVGPAGWVVPEDIALEARLDDDGRLVAETNVRQIAANLGLGHIDAAWDPATQPERPLRSTSISRTPISVSAPDSRRTLGLRRGQLRGRAPAAAAPRP